MLAPFRMMVAQNAQAAENLLTMGGDPERVSTGGNLKSTSAPCPSTRRCWRV
ncbi:hypothetical protein ACFSZS_11890 [Seohaeicola zhoushanensis]